MTQGCATGVITRGRRDRGTAARRSLHRRRAPPAREARREHHELSFDAVADITPPDRFSENVRCGHAVWVESPTGVAADLRGEVSFFRQLDCYVDATPTRFPELVHVAVYVEFDDESSADDYAAATGAFRATMVSGATVITVNPAFDSDYTADLAELCGCEPEIES